MIFIKTSLESQISVVQRLFKSRSWLRTQRRAVTYSFGENINIHTKRKCSRELLERDQESAFGGRRSTSQL